MVWTGMSSELLQADNDEKATDKSSEEKLSNKDKVMRRLGIDTLEDLPREKQLALHELVTLTLLPKLQRGLQPLSKEEIVFLMGMVLQVLHRTTSLMLRYPLPLPTLTKRLHH